MKIAVVYHFFPHYRKGVIEEIIRKFPEAKFYGQNVDSIDGIPSYRFSGDGRFVSTAVYRIGKYLFQMGLAKLCLARGTDCIVFLASPNFVSTWIFALCARLTGKRVIFWGHGFFSSKRTLRNLVRAQFFCIAHCFYAYGYYAKTHARAFGFKATDIYVGFNSLAYREQFEIRKRYSALACVAAEDRVWRILCVSRLTFKCRYDLLVEAVSLASRSSAIPMRIDFIGDGPDRMRLEQLGSQKNVDVAFHGAIYDEEKVASYIWNADIVVSPGKVGLTAIHSLMYGVPVITHGDFEHQMPEVEAIVDGVTGILFRRGDCGDLSRALIESTKLFADKRTVRGRCFRVVDEVYNPINQVRVLKDAIYGIEAEEGDSMKSLFLRDV